MFEKHTQMNANIFGVTYASLGVQSRINFNAFISGFKFSSLSKSSKPAYLNDLPRVLAYVFDTCERYEELHDMLDLLNELNLKPDMHTPFSFLTWPGDITIF